VFLTATFVTTFTYNLISSVRSSSHFHRTHFTQWSAEMVRTFWSAFYPLTIHILRSRRV